MTTQSHHEEPEDDPRVLAAAREYMAELEAQRRPDRQKFLAKHPEAAAALGPYLDALDLVHAAAPLLNGSTTDSLPPTAALPPAEPLGDYRIVREIGRGGMGVVYEAVQLSLGRRVALKVLPFAAALNGRQLQRFRTEAQAAAQLHHTNIVPVYAVGCERGVHFYAMQLIDGRPLDELIREAHDAAPGGETVGMQAVPTVATSRGRGREVYRTAARLAVQVADALEYAHDAGVIHRDIKPANLLLDARGTVWVTDFGLAQVTTEANLTQTGDVFGTLRYMSPEQAAGRRSEVDHRTDVYSLGATLYELLTLEPAFPGQDRHALLNQILHAEPRPPRQVDPAVPAELETIILKAMAKAPADRYATAGELAADLRRFLDGRPVMARRPTLAERVRKWLRRHPAYVGAAVLLLVAGVIGLGVSTALIAREQSHTRAALDAERRRAIEAEQRFQLARRSADEMIRIGNEELADGPQTNAPRRRLLEAALAYYQELINLRGDDPAAQQELAITRDRVQQILSDLAVLNGAWQHALLGEPAIQVELELSDDQRATAASILARINDDWDGGRLAPAEQFRRVFAGMKANEAAMVAALSPAQLRRLRQIAFQVRGPEAFREPEVTTALQLTQEQRKLVRSAEDSAFRRGGRLGLRPEDARQEAMAAILATLTPNQRLRWTELVGKPYTGPGPKFGPWLRGRPQGPPIPGPGS